MALAAAAAAPRTAGSKRQQDHSCTGRRPAAQLPFLRSSWDPRVDGKPGCAAPGVWPGRSRSTSPARDSSEYDKSHKKLRLGQGAGSPSMHMFTGAKQRDTWASIVRCAPRPACACRQCVDARLLPAGVVPPEAVLRRRTYSLDYAVLLGMVVALGLSELAAPYQRYIFSADDQVRPPRTASLAAPADPGKPAKARRLHAWAAASWRGHKQAAASCPPASPGPCLQAQEYWHYSYPLRTRNTVPSWSVPLIATLIPAAAFALHNFLVKPSRLEAHNTLLACWSAVFATALVTNLIKLGVRSRCCCLPVRRQRLAWCPAQHPLCSSPSTALTQGLTPCIASRSLVPHAGGQAQAKLYGQVLPPGRARVPRRRAPVPGQQRGREHRGAQELPQRCGPLPPPRPACPRMSGSAEAGGSRARGGQSLQARARVQRAQRQQARGVRGSPTPRGVRLLTAADVQATPPGAPLGWAS